MSWTRRQLWKMRLAVRGPYMRNSQRLATWQWASAAELEELQRESMRTALLHAHRCTHYYRRVLGAAGVVSEDGSVRLDRFTSLPLLDKPLLRREFENLKSADLAQRRWVANDSGGSTGEPARFVQDNEYEAWRGAVSALFDDWSGYRMGDRKVVLWGSEREIDKSKEPPHVLVGRSLRNEKRLRTYGLSEDDLVAHARTINAFRPVQILAYVESVYELARAIQMAGITMKNPTAVMTSAGTLFPTMRQAIEDAFGAPVFDKYGSREVGDIACECDRHRGLHVCSPCQHVEILRPDRSPAEPGEEGEIVVTNLTNRAMPLVRYRIGDTGSWATEPCTCGRVGPLLARVSGRVCDTFLNARGEQIEGKYFVTILDTRSWLRRFRVIQETIDSVDVYLQLYRDLDDEETKELDEIKHLIRQAMGPECSVTIKVVPEIEPLPSGKHRVTISKVRRMDEVRR